MINYDAVMENANAEFEGFATEKEDLGDVWMITWKSRDRYIRYLIDFAHGSISVAGSYGYGAFVMGHSLSTDDLEEMNVIRIADFLAASDHPQKTCRKEDVIKDMAMADPEAVLESLEEVDITDEELSRLMELAYTNPLKVTDKGLKKLYDFDTVYFELTEERESFGYRIHPLTIYWIVGLHMALKQLKK